MEQKAQTDEAIATAEAALLERFAPRAAARTVQWSGGRTRALEMGEGPPLLLIHGGLGSAFEWVPVFRALGRRHRVIALDRPGHGLADGFDYTGVDFIAHASTFLREAMQALALPSAHLVGNSLGGLASVALALEAPERVASLTLVGKPMGCDRKVPLQMRPLGLPWIGQLLGRLLMSNPSREENRKFWSDVLVTHAQGLDDTLLDADVAHQARNLDSMLSLIKRVGTLGGLHRSLVLADRWQRLKVPTRLVWGERDAFGGPDDAKAILRHNPSIEVARVPDAGHLPWFDAPDRVVTEIETFVRSRTRDAGSGPAQLPPHSPAL